MVSIGLIVAYEVLKEGPMGLGGLRDNVVNNIMVSIGRIVAYEVLKAGPMGLGGLRDNVVNKTFGYNKNIIICCLKETLIFKYNLFKVNWFNQKT